MGADSKTKTQEENPARDSGILVEDAPVIRTASLKKLKGNKKKFFVLTDTTSTCPARLEYYDNERKWKSKAAPKRSIVLEKCFNINRKLDTRDSRNRFVIALYTLDDCVSIVFETENELNDWLDQLLTLQQGKHGNIDGRKPVPNYEHMFTVIVKNFTPEENNFTQVNHLLGQQRLCVTPNSVMFFPVGSENSVEFPHACIRGCANSDRHFKLETGRNSPTGSGSLVIDCDDKDVTHHLHETMLRAMQNSKNKEMYLPRTHGTRNRSQSLSEAQRMNQNSFPPKSLPRAVEPGRNRTISEPPDKPGQVTPEPGLPPRRPISMRYAGSYSTSPNIKSPISPVGSMSTGISSDGTGSSNSINEPYLVNGDHDNVNYSISNQPDVIPEESSGEISIEFNPKPAAGAVGGQPNQTLPRAGPSQHHPAKYVHQKQASLTEFTMDDYMDMSVGAASSSSSSKTPSFPGPPLPKRNNEDSLTSSRSSSKLSSITSPTVGQPSSYVSEMSEYHVMRPSQSRLEVPTPTSTTPQMSPPDQGIYFDMDRLTISDQQVTSTPLKSTSTTTLVQSDSHDQSLNKDPSSCSSPAAKTPPVAIRSPGSVSGSDITPSTVLTPPGDEPIVKTRIPSGDGGYVVMSPGVSHNIGAGAIGEEHSSLAILEESLGGHWRSSPRHASPSFMRERSRPDSKRNSSCYDDSEAHWDQWRYEDPPLGPDDNYALVYYPGSGRNITGRPTPHSRLSPSSSSSAMSGTPSSNSNFTDFHDRLHQISSYIRDDDADDRVTSRPPPVNRKSLSTTTPKHIPSTSSNNSSRSNISPFGKTPPSLLAGSPTIVSRLEGLTGLFRHRAGSVPSRPPVERRRHRTQSEGEKDSAQNP